MQAIRKLHVLGPGFGVITVGGQRLVSSVPHSLSTDTNAALELAQVPANVRDQSCRMVTERRVGSFTAAVIGST